MKRLIAILAILALPCKVAAFTPLGEADTLSSTITLSSVGTTLYQSADAVGFSVNGFDDRSTSYIKMSVDAAGTGALQTNGILYLNAGTNNPIRGVLGGTGDFDWRTDSDSTFQVGDGTYSWGHTPEFGVEGVAEFDKAAYFDGQSFGAIPAAQTIASGNTVAADSCGGVKRITAAGAVTTDTTNTFTAPAAANSSCCMDVINVGAENITLDNNANFKSAGAADVVLGANDTVRVCSTGASGAWYQIGATGNN